MRWLQGTEKQFQFADEETETLRNEKLTLVQKNEICYWQTLHLSEP